MQNSFLEGNYGWQVYFGPICLTQAVLRGLTLCPSPTPRWMLRVMCNFWYVRWLSWNQTFLHAIKRKQVASDTLHSKTVMPVVLVLMFILLLKQNSLHWADLQESWKVLWTWSGEAPPSWLWERCALCSVSPGFPGSSHFIFRRLNVSRKALGLFLGCQHHAFCELTLPFLYL